jgi:hypothetical protein
VTDAEKIRLIEQDRRRRERELLLLLLLLLEECTTDVAFALRHGVSVVQVLNNVLNRAAVPLSRVMAAAHIGGLRRFASLAGQTFSPLDDATKAAIAREYEPQASDAVRAIVTTLVEAMADVQAKFPDESPSVLAQSAFDNAGMSRADKTALRLGAERMIVTASNLGMMGAILDNTYVYGRRELLIRHHTVLDGRETDICHDRANLTLPASHPYWRSGGVPQLHWRCRSILMPAPADAEISSRLPTVPAAPGFGFSPLPRFSHSYRAA